MIAKYPIVYCLFPQTSEDELNLGISCYYKSLYRINVHKIQIFFIFLKTKQGSTTQYLKTSRIL